MEILWIDVVPDDVVYNAASDEIGVSFSTQARTATIGDLADPEVIGLVFEEMNLLTSGAIKKEYPLRIDLTDRNGFGQLIATDNLFVNMATGGQAGAVTISWRIYYRLVRVSTQEYIGIIQSQQ